MTLGIDTGIKWKYSGGASNANPTLSLGGTISSVDVPTSIDYYADVYNNLFADAELAECTTGAVKYRCFYVKNELGVAMSSVILLIDGLTWSWDVTMEIGVGTSGVSGVEQTIANETTGPTGITWYEYVTHPTTVALPNLANGAWVALWLRRTVPAGMYNNDPDVKVYFVMGKAAV